MKYNITYVGKLDLKFTNIKELADFLKKKVYEVTPDPSYTVRQKVEVFCLEKNVSFLKGYISSIVQNNPEIAENKLKDVFNFAVSIGYKGEEPQLKSIPIRSMKKNAGLLNKQFAILNKKLFFQ